MCVLHFTHTCSFVGGSRVSISGLLVSFEFLFSATSVTLLSIFEHHWFVTRISFSSVFTVIARMANLWLRTMDSMTMHSEENSEEFVDVTDQSDWPVADDSVEVFMQTRFRTMKMTQLQLLVLSLPFPENVPVSTLHHIQLVCRCLFRWILLPHNF